MASSSKTTNEGVRQHNQESDQQNLIDKFQSGIAETMSLIDNMDGETKQKALKTLQTLISDSSPIQKGNVIRQSYPAFTPELNRVEDSGTSTNSGSRTWCDRTVTIQHSAVTHATLQNQPLISVSKTYSDRRVCMEPHVELSSRGTDFDSSSVSFPTLPIDSHNSGAELLLPEPVEIKPYSTRALIQEHSGKVISSGPVLNPTVIESNSLKVIKDKNPHNYPKHGLKIIHVSDGKPIGIKTLQGVSVSSNPPGSDLKLDQPKTQSVKICNSLEVEEMIEGPAGVKVEQSQIKQENATTSSDVTPRRSRRTTQPTLKLLEQSGSGKTFTEEKPMKWVVSNEKDDPLQLKTYLGSKHVPDQRQENEAIQLQDIVDNPAEKVQADVKQRKVMQQQTELETPSVQNFKRSSSQDTPGGTKRPYKPQQEVLAFLRRVKSQRSLITQSRDVDDAREDNKQGEVQDGSEEDVDRKHLVRRCGHSIRHVTIGDSTSWLCDTCNKVFQFRATALLHLRSHTGEKPYTCDTCDKSFGVEANMLRHVKDVHGHYPFMCMECNLDFKSKKQLNDHLKEVHNSEIKKEIPCLHCGEIFFHKIEYGRHLRMMHPNEARKFECRFCHKKFNHQPNLARHLKTHSEEKPFACELCDASFIEKRGLQVHMIRNHDDPQHKPLYQSAQKFQCQTCGKEFFTKGNLNVHLRVHSRLQPYECSVCRKHFSVKSNLKRHERIHLGEKPYPCPDCGKCFSERRSMVVHRRLHTGEKPYECEVCHKRFAQLGTLNTHRPSHTKERKFKCDACPATFLRRSHLTLHSKKHVEAPNLPCEQCGLKFYKRSDLLCHVALHSNLALTGSERGDAAEFQCHLCHRRFTRAQHLQQHLNTHSQDKHFTLETVDQSQLAAEGIMSLAAIGSPPVVMETSNAMVTTEATPSNNSSIVLESGLSESLVQDIQKALAQEGASGEWQVIVAPGDSGSSQSDIQQFTLQTVNQPVRSELIVVGDDLEGTESTENNMVAVAQASDTYVQTNQSFHGENTSTFVQKYSNNLPVLGPGENSYDNKNQLFHKHDNITNIQDNSNTGQVAQQRVNMSGHSRNIKSEHKVSVFGHNDAMEVAYKSQNMDTTNISQPILTKHKSGTISGEIMEFGPFPYKETDRITTNKEEPGKTAPPQVIYEQFEDGGMSMAMSQSGGDAGPMEGYVTEYKDDDVTVYKQDEGGGAGGQAPRGDGQQYMCYVLE